MSARAMLLGRLAQVEERLEFYESGKAPKKNVDVMAEALKAVETEQAEVASASKTSKKSKKRKLEDDEDKADTPNPATDAPAKKKKGAKGATKKVVQRELERFQTGATSVIVDRFVPHITVRKAPRSVAFTDRMSVRMRKRAWPRGTKLRGGIERRGGKCGLGRARRGDVGVSHGIYRHKGETHVNQEDCVDTPVHDKEGIELGLQ